MRYRRLAQPESFCDGDVVRGLLSVEALRVSRRAAHDEAPGRNPNVALAGGDDNLPVEQVTWDEAKHFCEAVGGRLPTEAEWEYAARAGTAGERYGNLEAIAWYAGNSSTRNSGGQTHPVGSKASNAWNLYDMLGNVNQWIADWFGEKYYGQQESTDPQGPAYSYRAGFGRKAQSRIQEFLNPISSHNPSK